MSSEISARPPNLRLRNCPCGRQTISPITDNATGEKSCFHCAGPHVHPDIIRFARKMQHLFDIGRLSEECYPIAERVRNLSGDWTPIQ